MVPGKDDMGCPVLDKYDMPGPMPDHFGSYLSDLSNQVVVVSSILQMEKLSLREIEATELVNSNYNLGLS